MSGYARAPTTPSHSAGFGNVFDAEAYELQDPYHPYDRTLSTGTKDSSAPLLSSPDPRRTSFNPYQPSPPPTPEPPRQVGKSSGFEKPHWSALWIHLIACGLAWPVLYLFVLVGQERSLFVTRLAVGAGGGIVGFTLGLTLLGLGQRYLEACTWASIIHQSHSQGGAQGMRLRDLEAHSGDPTSAFIALRVLWNRYMQTGTTRKARASYDNRPWTMFILLFLLIVVIAGAGPFALGRIVTIETHISQQFETYEEIKIKGDLSPADIERARSQVEAFETFILTWTISPFSVRTTLPAVVKLRWENDDIYFSETIRHQLSSDGAGFGTFEPLDDRNMTSSTESNPTFTKDIIPGSALIYPRWGLRIHCEKLPDPEINIIGRSNATFSYQFIPQSTLNSLFTSFNMELPETYKTPLNMTDFLRGNDTIPEGMDPSQISLGAVFFDNGVAHSLKSFPHTMGDEGNGWVSIESVLLRLNETYAPNGKFGSKSEFTMPDKNGNPTHIGYDGVVCLELFEPWVTMTTVPSFGLPSTDRIIKKGTDLDAAGTNGRRTNQRINEDRVLHSANNKSVAYNVAHQNSVNQIIKDNGRDAFFVPSPTSVSFTDGYGAYGYTELDATLFANSRAMADASNILPYLVGTGDIVALSYTDQTTSSAKIEPRWMGCFLAVYVALGFIAAFLVPRLPLGVPRRGFEVYSWFAAFKKDEVVVEGSHGKLRKGMTLEQMSDVMGDMRLRYVL